MYKLGQFVQGAWLGHSHAAVFERQTMNDGSDRLKVGVPAGDVEVPRQLTRCMEPPYETSRGEGDMGRYQSPPIERAEFDAFLSRYQAYLRSDGRFALWIYTPQAMVVWDHHNLIYAYGVFSCFEDALRSMGFAPGRLSIPVPHQHNYRPECDADAAAILGHFDWRRSELRSGNDT